MFTLEIDPNAAGPFKPVDVIAYALESTARQVRAGKIEGETHDVNGTVIGKYNYDPFS